MTVAEKIFRYKLLVGLACLIFAMCAYITHHPVHADDASRHEVVPYKFADLPHGRIYKAVHEDCELYIVETDIDLPSVYSTQHQYAVATGRGCR